MINLNNEKRKKESSLILRKAKFQAIFEFVLPLASKASSYKQPQNVVYNADGEVFLSRRRTTVKRGEIRKRVPEDKSCKLLSRLDGIKYNRILAFVSIPVLLIRSSLEKFFKKNFRDDSSFCFGFAKVLALALIFSIITISKSQAAEIPTGGASGTCNSAGTCLWTLDESGKMTISAATGAKDVRMDNYYCQLDYCRGGGGDRPWENYLQDIKNVVVGDNITYIGKDAFQSAHNLETVTGMKDVTTIGESGVFAWATSLKSIEMPNVTYVGHSAFYDASSLESVDMPNIKTIVDRAFYHATALQYVGLPVDENGNPLNVNIADNAFSGANSAVINCSNENRSACGSCGNGYVMSGTGCVSDCGAGYLGKEGRCIDSSLGCGNGYRQFEDFCNRIQYTPAEAAKVLRDDNTNEVTITFRK